MNIKKIIGKLFIFIFISGIIVISVFPLLWVLLSSFKTNREILNGGLGLPAAFGFKNYRDALKIAPIPQFYMNSVIVAVGATAGGVFLLSMAAYVIARFRGRLRNGFKMMLCFR